MTFENYIPPKFDEWFMRQVYLVATKSKDKSSKIGAIIVNDNQIVKIGYNGFPVGVNDNISERYERPLKYAFTSHAEANAVSFAAKDGVKTDGCILYTNGICCIECCKIVIQSGIKEVIYHKQFNNKWNELYRPQWDGHEEISSILFKESDVKLTAFDKFLDVNSYIDGKIIKV
jgi:dCMP deaminase